MQLRTDGVHRRESTGKEPLFLKVVPVTGAAILQVTMDQLMCASCFSHPLLIWSGHVDRRYLFICIHTPNLYFFLLDKEQDYDENGRTQNQYIK